MTKNHRAHKAGVSCPNTVFTLVLCAVAACGGTVLCHAQQVGVAISVDGAAPNTNAMLDIQSPATGDGKGLLIPRVTTAQRTIPSTILNGGLLNNAGDLRGGPAEGLMVYQTDGSKGFYYNTSTSAAPSWVKVGDLLADGSIPMSGMFDMNGNSIADVSSIAFNDGHVPIGLGAECHSSSEGGVAIGRDSSARYRQSGVAIGTRADADYNGIAIGYQTDGQYSNIAVGFQANAYSGYDRIAIGCRITNRVNNSIAVRGTLYLDGGTGVMYRSTVGSGGWTLKAFTIDHPLDPANKVLRHFCMEGPEVWNVYAGNAQLVNGRAEVALPDYYSALNKVGSEVFSLTPVGALAQVAVGDEMNGNRFTIIGDKDVKVSWSIKVLRNDPACLEDLRRRPVEQLKSAMDPGQAAAESGSVNTLNIGEDDGNQ